MSQNNLIERNMIYNNTIGIYSSFSGCDNILENVMKMSYLITIKAFISDNVNTKK